MPVQRACPWPLLPRSTAYEMELLGSVAAHRHARRPYGVIARARRDAPLQGVPPTAAP